MQWFINRPKQPTINQLILTGDVWWASPTPPAPPWPPRHRRCLQTPPGAPPHLPLWVRRRCLICEQFLYCCRYCQITIIFFLISFISNTAQQTVNIFTISFNIWKYRQYFNIRKCLQGDAIHHQCPRLWLHLPHRMFRRLKHFLNRALKVFTLSLSLFESIHTFTFAGAIRPCVAEPHPEVQRWRPSWSRRGSSFLWPQLWQVELPRIVSLVIDDGRPVL